MQWLSLNLQLLLKVTFTGTTSLDAEREAQQRAKQANLSGASHLYHLTYKRSCTTLGGDLSTGRRQGVPGHRSFSRVLLCNPKKTSNEVQPKN